MYCKKCNHETLDKFVNTFYVVNYCDKCKLSNSDFKTFKEICISDLKLLSSSNLLKNLIKQYLEETLFQYKFGVTIDTMKCAYNPYCMNLTDCCHIFQYNFHNFIFYFCGYKDQIVFNENAIIPLLKKLKYKFYGKYIKIKIKNYFNIIINKVKKLKNLFIIENK